MKEKKVMISTKVSPETFQEMRYLSYETGLRQYQLIEQGVKYLAQKYKDGKLKVVRK